MTRIIQYTAAFTSILSALCGGLHFGWTSSNLPILLSKDTPIPMSNDESSWVAIIFLIGGSCGTAFTGSVLNILGRKKLLLLSSVPFFTSWMIIAFANTLTTLLVARFIAGLSDGVMYGVTPMYISEISDPEIRGGLCSCITIMYGVGVVGANVLGSYLSIKNAALICSVVPLIFVLAFVWMPESPYFLLLKGRIDQARRSLMALKRSQNVDAKLQEISKGIQEKNEVSLRCFDVFIKQYRKNMLVIVGIRATQLFSGWVGLVFYAKTVFAEASGSLSPLLSVVIFHCAQITFALVSSFVVDKLGRRPLLIVSLSGCCLSLLVAGVYFVIRDVRAVDVSHVTWVATLMLMTFIISYGVGLQTMPLFMVAEIFPTNVKAHATAISNIYYYVFGLCALKFFQYTKDEYGMHVPFFTFSVCCLFGLIFTVRFVPETKNKTLEEIQTELKNKN